MQDVVQLGNWERRILDGAKDRIGVINVSNVIELIESTKFALAKTLDDELRISPAKEEVVKDINLNFTQSIMWASQILDIKKGRFKEKMDGVLNELKVALVRSIIDESSTKNRYEVVFLKTKSKFILGQVREIIELRDGDIPVEYRTYLSVCSGSASEMVMEAVAEGEVIPVVPINLKSGYRVSMTIDMLGGRTAEHLAVSKDGGNTDPADSEIIAKSVIGKCTMRGSMFNKNVIHFLKL
jgi:hypothetical protein